MKTIAQHIQQGTHPRCADRGLFRAWFNAGQRGGDMPTLFCEDCTKGYEQAMREVGRCAKEVV